MSCWVKCDRIAGKIRSLGFLTAPLARTHPWRWLRMELTFIFKFERSFWCYHSFSPEKCSLTQLNWARCWILALQQVQSMKTSHERLELWSMIKIYTIMNVNVCVMRNMPWRGICRRSRSNCSLSCRRRRRVALAILILPSETDDALAHCRGAVSSSDLKRHQF